MCDAQGQFLANAAHASRKDLRDAVVAARKAFGGWSGATAYNRGQVLYRVAEVMEGRHDQFVAEVAACEGLPARKAESIVDAAVDRWVWYAGWTDKLAAVLGRRTRWRARTSRSPFRNPPVWWVCWPPRGRLCWAGERARSGARHRVHGRGGEQRGACRCRRSRCPRYSRRRDVPGGAVNVLTGRASELGSWLASHEDVDAIDPTGADSADRVELAREAAGTVKRVLDVPDEEPDWTRRPGLGRLRTYLEPKTVWHPMGV